MLKLFLGKLQVKKREKRLDFSIFRDQAIQKSLTSEHKMKKQYIDLTPEQTQALMERIENNTLTDKDRTLCSSTIDLVLWLQNELRESKLSIKRLRNLFDIKTEKKTLMLTKLQQALMTTIQD